MYDKFSGVIECDSPSEAILGRWESTINFVMTGGRLAATSTNARSLLLYTDISIWDLCSVFGGPMRWIVVKGRFYLFGCLRSRNEVILSRKE